MSSHPEQTGPEPLREHPGRKGLVLGGGGARGAYEAGVLAYFFEDIAPRLGPDFEFDVVSGTSVGAIHAAYVVATSGLDPATRAHGLIQAWSEMRLANLLRLSPRDLLALPLRALGLTARKRLPDRSGGTLGGLVDLAPLEALVRDSVPWERLRAQLDGGSVGVLCIACTEVGTGRVTVFMDGRLADPQPWSFDPNAQGLVSHIGEEHVRASAALPFLFPAVRIGDRFFVDGGLRLNTPLSPVLRLESERVLVVSVKSTPRPVNYDESFVTQPAFLLGKVLDALLLDPLAYELERLELINALLDRGESVYGPDFLSTINQPVVEKRGTGYRRVHAAVVRPSADLGEIAASCYRRAGGALGAVSGFLARIAQRGVPTGEADLLSYLYFDRSYTNELIALGREDARRQEAAIVRALGFQAGAEVAREDAG